MFWVLWEMENIASSCVYLTHHFHLSVMFFVQLCSRISWWYEFDFIFMFVKSCPTGKFVGSAHLETGQCFELVLMKEMADTFQIFCFIGFM